MEESELESQLQCQVCTLIKPQMVRSNGCKAILCQECITDHSSRNHKCPRCNGSEFSYFSDILLNNLVSLIKKPCPIGGEKYRLSELDRHQKEGVTEKCKLCGEKIKKSTVFKHVEEAHGEEFLRVFVESSELEAKSESGKINEKEREETKADVTPKLDQKRKKYKDKEVNEAGVPAKKDRNNGKYYCGRPIKTKIKKMPKKGEGGKLNGKDGMKLDLEAREIIGMHLINGAGEKTEFFDTSFRGGKRLDNGHVGKGEHVSETGPDGWKLHLIFNSVEHNEFPYMDLVCPKHLILDKK